MVRHSHQQKIFCGFQVVALLATVGICAKLVYASVLAPIFDHNSAARLTELRRQAKEDQTVPGIFLDCNGTPLSSSEDGPGSEGTLLYPQSTSALIGYHDDRFGSAGLRNTCRETIYEEGENVELTLDIRLQELAYSFLPENASAIVIENGTGAILCLASRSTVELDYNDLEQTLQTANGTDESLYVRGIYEADAPGSVVKILTAAAALEAEEKAPGSVDFEYYADTSFFVPGSEMVIHDYAGVARGTLTLSQAFSVSSNPYFACLGLQPGVADELRQLYDRLKYGQPWDLDFTRLKSTIGDLNTAEEIAQISFGQGEIAVTPLQLAATVSAFFNGGTLMKPHLLASTQPEGLCTGITSPQTLSAVQEIMRQAATTYGLTEETTGVVVGAKTGTAQCTGGRLHLYLIASTTDFTYAISVNDSQYSSSSLYPLMQKLIWYTENA